MVIKWTKSLNQDFTEDMKGWQKGKPRKHTEREIKRIKEIHQELVNDSQIFFAGASVILEKWQEKYP